jgi:acetylglutamate kinase
LTKRSVCWEALAVRITVKLGGSILEDAAVRASILRQVAELCQTGAEVILVHGGGKTLSRRLTQLGLPSQFIDGLRVTDGETLRAALMVLAGEVNKSLVLELAGRGVKALGICGADGLAVRCARASDLSGYPSGLGFVGKPTAVNRRLFDMMLEAGLLPVVASIAAGEDFQAYNVNADQMASVCAWGTGCDALIYLTDVGGVLDANGVVLPRIGRDEIEGLRAAGVIAGGMLPKTDSCLEALARGVRSVYILPGTAPDVMRKYIDGTLTEGTMIHEAA